MLQLLLPVDRVLVTAAVAGLGQVARPPEVVDDLGCGALGDADGGCDVSKPRVRVGGMQARTRAWFVTKLQRRSCAAAEVTLVASFEV